MKPNRFLWLFLILFAGSAGTYFLSCQRDADQLQVKPLSDTPVGERACLEDNGCSFVITAATNCTVELCGDILNYTGACSNGCNSLSADHFLSVSLTANTPYTFCVFDYGSVCVRNPSTATQSIDVAVQVAGTTAINVNIPVGESQCFHSDLQCSATYSGCY